MDRNIVFIISMLLPVAATAVFCVWERFGAFGKRKPVLGQIIIGIVFACTAVLATKWGLLSTGGTFINVRDASPVCAAFLFSPLSGIIAAVISGVHRLVLGLVWDNGSFTAVACGLSTLLAGISAAAIQHFFRKTKRVSLLFFTLFSIVAEGTDLLLIFLTNLDNTAFAYNIVSDVALRLITFNALTVVACSLIASLIRRDNLLTHHRSERGLSTVMEWVLIISMLAAFLLTGFLTNVMQTKTVKQRTEETLKSQISLLEIDTIKSVELSIHRMILQASYFGKANLSALLELEKKDIIDLNNDGKRSKEEVAEKLNAYRVIYGFSQIDLIAADKSILYSTDPAQVGKTFENDNFYNVVDKEDAYVEFLPILSGDHACAGIKTEQTSDYLKNVKYVCYSYTRTFFYDLIHDCISESTSSYDFGTTGAMMVLKKQPESDGSRAVVKTGFIDNPGYVRFFDPDSVTENTMIELRYNDADRFMTYDEFYGYYILAFEHKGTVLETRDFSVALSQLMEMEIFAFISLILYLFIRFYIIRKLNKVNVKLEEICAGNLDVSVDVRDCKEFAILSDDINSTVDTLKHYIAVEAARLDKELLLARQIQSAALPSVFPPFPNCKEIDIYADMTPAKYVGGDFYDFFFISENKLAFLVADVAGKGIPAALFMMTAKVLLKSIALQGQGLKEVFETANAHLCESNTSRMFVTVWMGLLDITNGELQYVNAGHNAPILIQGGVNQYLKGRTGFVLAGLNNMKYETKTVVLAPGDRILLYTDGVTEAKDKNNRFYGEKRLSELVDQVKDGSAEEICKAVKEDVNAFAANCEQADDITVLTVCYNGSEAPVTAQRSFPAEYEVTKDAIAYVADVLQKAQASDAIVDRFKVCTDEVFSNIAKFAYPDKQGDVLVQIACCPDKYFVTFADSGVPFDPLSYVNPELALSAKERKPGGLGISLVKRLMSEVSYAYVSGENRLTLTLNTE